MCQMPWPFFRGPSIPHGQRRRMLSCRLPGKKEGIKEGVKKMKVCPIMFKKMKVCPIMSRWLPLPIMSRWLPLTTYTDGVTEIHFFEKQCLKGDCQLWAEYGGYCRMGNT